MQKRKTIFIVVGIGLAVAVVTGGWWYLGRPTVSAASVQNLYAPPASGLRVSGFIEADEIAVASEMGGRVIALPVEAGAEIKTGAVLVELDRTTTEAELAVAQAKVAAARAALARLKAGARAEDIQQAEVAVQMAAAQRAAAYQAWQDAKLQVNQQQTLDLQIKQAQTQITVTQEYLNAAVARERAVEVAKANYDGAVDQLRKLGRPAPYSQVPLLYWQSWINVNATGASYDGAVALLKDLEAERRWPVAQVAGMHAAEAAYLSATAAVTQTQALLTDLKAGATVEQIAAAEAQVRVAEAGEAAVKTRIGKLTLTASANGVVLERPIHVGELAAPGATLLTLADLDTVSLVVYVPENQLNLARLGQKVPVQVDSFPDQTFSGEVVWIADQAEFIPNKVQTQEDRVTLVFAVKIHLPNAEHKLKPGLPADAVLE